MWSLGMSCALQFPYTHTHTVLIYSKKSGVLRKVRLTQKSAAVVDLTYSLKTIVSIANIFIEKSEYTLSKLYFKNKRYRLCFKSLINFFFFFWLQENIHQNCQLQPTASVGQSGPAWNNSQVKGQTISPCPISVSKSLALSSWLFFYFFCSSCYIFQSQKKFKGSLWNAFRQHKALLSSVSRWIIFPHVTPLCTCLLCTEKSPLITLALVTPISTSVELNLKKLKKSYTSVVASAKRVAWGLQNLKPLSHIRCRLSAKRVQGFPQKTC